MIVLWYFWSVRVIDMVFDAFWGDLCDIVIFGGLERLIVDFSQHLLICTLDGKTNYAIRSGTLISGW